MIEILLCTFLSFLIGSIPTGYIFVRIFNGMDLRKEGSGNIGTMNAFEVSRSKKIGSAVLIIDLIKGAIPLLLVHLVFGDAFMLGAVSLAFIILGHNYSPWIGFKGGRGLAPAAGGGLLFNPYFVLLWIFFWSIAYLKTRNIIFGNLAATVLSPFILFFTPGITAYLSLFIHQQDWHPVLIFFLLSGIIFIKHINPLRELIRTGIVPD